MTPAFSGGGVMSRSTVALGLLLASSPAFAYGPYGGTGPCGGFVTRHWVGQPSIPTQVVIVPDLPVVGGGGGGAAVHGASPVGSAPDVGSMKAEALLIAAVVAAAALPAVVYALDAPATHDIEHCWAMPTERFQFYGGALGVNAGSTGYFGMRGGISAAFFAVDGSAEGSGYGYRDLAAALALRAVPRQHIDVALAFGVRQVFDGFALRNWFEVALPHRYLPFREDAANPGLGIDVRPAFLFGGDAFDVRLDASLVIPFGPWAALELGGRAYTFDSQVRTGGLVGLHFSL
jgi:hypothetical protein